MAKLGKENVFLVEVDDKFALIDRNAGMIHVVDADNAQLWNKGEEFEMISSENSIIQAGSVTTIGETGPGSSLDSEFAEVDSYEQAEW